LIAPLIVPFSFLAFAVIFSNSLVDDLSWEDLIGFVIMFGVLYIVSLVGLVVFGLPVVAILSRIGRLRIWTMMIAGAIVGAMLGWLEYSFLFDAGPGHGKPPAEFNVYSLLKTAGIMGLAGFLVAAAFGVVAKIKFW